MLRKAFLFILALVILSNTVAAGNTRAEDTEIIKTNHGVHFTIPKGWTDVSDDNRNEMKYFSKDDVGLILYVETDMNKDSNNAYSRKKTNELSNSDLSNEALEKSLENFKSPYISKLTSIEITRETRNGIGFIRADAMADINDANNRTAPAILHILYQDGYVYEFCFFALDATQFLELKAQYLSVVDSFTYPKAQEQPSSTYEWMIPLALLIIVAIIIFFAIRKKNRKAANQSAQARLCKQCGSQLPDEALFCPVCGHDMKAFQKPAVSAPIHTPVESAIKPGNIMSKKILKREVAAWVFLAIQFFLLKTTFEHFPSFDWNAPSSQVQHMGNLAQTAGYLLAGFSPLIVAGILFISVAIKKKADEKAQEKSASL